MTRGTIGLLALGLAAAACGGDSVLSPAALPQLSDVTPAEWATLASRRMFFGHQSVGVNIVQGLTEVLAAHPEIHLNVVESRELAGIGQAGFFHAKVGGNEHADEKADDFVTIVSQGLAGSGDVGMLKFCYVDVRANTDPKAFFTMYQERLARLRARNPGLIIVHFTMPLTISEGFWRYWRLKLRGYETDRDRNVVRNRYNALLRQAYAGKEPVFDIAALETRGPNGSVSSFRGFGGTYYSLAREYTTDGGHLNEAGRRLVAEQLLIFLAELPASAGDSRATS